jgi:membrane-bound ClpP family serine protease
LEGIPGLLAEVFVEVFVIGIIGLGAILIGTTLKMGKSLLSGGVIVEKKAESGVNIEGTLQLGQEG